MQQLDNAIVFSATDLNNALACAHLTTLDLAALRGELERPTDRPPEAELLARLGEEHERRYLTTLTELGQRVVTIDRSAGLQAAARATEAAMERGAPVIYQAAFFDGIWAGYADFVRRIDAPGGRWPWRYEVEDTKLARHTEPYFLLQLCYYSEHVARIQGVEPESMYVVLGDGSHHAFRVAEFSAYYRRVKDRFLARLAADQETYPDPTPQCARCVWNPRCEARRAADDHLSAVANITRLQIGRLTADGISTLGALAEASPDAPPAKMAPHTFVTLQRQARLQNEQRLAVARGEPHPYRYELLAASVTEKRGFHRLPEPSPGDVFFDMEGDPYYDIGTGLEYLFGAFTADDGRFHAFWGCDRSERPVNDRLAEKRAFEAFIDFVFERRARDPKMHVYHYASYEKTALSKLALRHATREDEVDVLLREEVLVDLYAIVKQSIVVGQPSYSIKKIEDFYGKRGGESGVTGGGESILRFDQWLTLRTDPALRDDAILADLERYNRYDCESTLGLRDWLLQLRLDAQRTFATEVPWFAGTPPPEEKPQRVDRFEAIIAALTDRIPDTYDPAASSDDDPVRPFFLVRHMLAYHAREDKPVWWAFHDRSATYHDDPQQLLDDTETIVGLEPDGPPVPQKKSLLHTFRFPQQIHKIGAGDEVFDPATKDKVGEVVTLVDDDTQRRITVLRGPSRAGAPLPTAITLRDLARRQPVIDAIARFAGALVEGRQSRYRAAYDVLTRALPRVRGRVRGEVLQPEMVSEASVGAVVDALDESYLFVQGPPGSGKTTLAAGLIANLLRRGCTVGVTANSHAAIHHLLGAIERETLARGVRLAGQKRCSTDNPDTHYVSESRRIENVTDFSLGSVNLVAGTAWAFGKEHMDAQLDYVFIDEAGQLALPLAISVMTAARNVVLLGDPQQLAQVSHASHPGDIGASVLDHVLGSELATVPPERGILLRDSYRMHPDVCRFISDTMYDGRLRSAPGRERQHVDSPGLRGAGLRFMPVEHTGNVQESRAEAETIADAIATLLTGSVTAVDGLTRPLGPSDIIVVAPYNAQVHCLRKILRGRGLGAIAVGTVDKFQGREADVVFFSTASSTAQDAPRGARFIFDRQRLNVAISRARALAVLVASPALLDMTCASIEDVRIANGVCRLLELAAAHDRPAPAAAEPATLVAG